MTMTDEQRKNFQSALVRDSAQTPKIGLDTLEQASEHAAKIGGELLLRIAIARGDFTERGALVAQAWVDAQERERADAHALQTIKSAERSAIAAERSARWTFLAALMSLAALLISVDGRIIDLLMRLWPDR